MQHTIPKRVQHDEVIEALKPLMELLGTDINSVYSSVPVVIDFAEVNEGKGSISFAVAAGELDDKGRAESVKAVAHPQNPEYGELAYLIRVDVGYIAVDGEVAK